MLLRKESLYFHDQVLREGKDGESFHVLAYRGEQKKVFVSAKDPQGKEIALAVDEAAVAVIHPNPLVLLDKAAEAAEDRKFDAAAALIAEALRAKPADEDIQKAQRLVASAREIKQRLDTSKAAFATIQTQADRQRHNASITDRPNPLTHDDTNQTRAREMREQADAKESRAGNGLKDAERDLENRVSDLKELVVARQRVLKGITAGPIPLADLKALEKINVINQPDAGNQAGELRTPSDVSAVSQRWVSKI